MTDAAGDALRRHPPPDRHHARTGRGCRRGGARPRRATRPSRPAASAGWNGWPNGSRPGRASPARASTVRWSAFSPAATASRPGASRPSRPRSTGRCWRISRPAAPPSTRSARPRPRLQGLRPRPRHAHRRHRRGGRHGRESLRRHHGVRHGGDGRRHGPAGGRRDGHRQHHHRGCDLRRALRRRGRPLGRARHRASTTRASQRKVAAVEAALARHREHLKDPLEMLRRLGGREVAAIAGAILAARLQRIPVILDGYVTTAAAADPARHPPGDPRPLHRRPSLRRGRSSGRAGAARQGPAAGARHASRRRDGRGAGGRDRQGCPCGAS